MDLIVFHQLVTFFHSAHFDLLSCILLIENACISKKIPINGPLDGHVDFTSQKCVDDSLITNTMLFSFLGDVSENYEPFRIIHAIKGEHFWTLWGLEIGFI
jgi:hypothetical protein